MVAVLLVLGLYDQGYPSLIDIWQRFTAKNSTEVPSTWSFNHILPTTLGISHSGPGHSYEGQGHMGGILASG